MNTLDESINGLRRRMPQMSAYRTFSANQLRVLVVGAVLIVVALALQTLPALLTLNLVVTVIYFSATLFKVHLAWRSLLRPAMVQVSDEEARSIPDSELPLYTILIPAYHEAPVIAQILAAVNSLEYPPSQMEIKVLLEEDDLETMLAALQARSGPDVEIVSIPFGKPRTKPKACNYGLLLSKGEFVTIFDAEDQPEPLQLRRAVAAFRRLDRSVACLQCKLSYHNATQNLITRWFTIEYGTWFSMLLPTLAAAGGPVPLGGTSMHIRRSVLTSVGAWDAHNVTEDADLGIRLKRLGYETAVLDSTTYEEANSDFINWVKQRSRWYKGYLQTWLVHMRSPLELWQQLGPRGFIRFNLLLGATPVVALLNPLFWVLTVLWFSGKPPFIQTLFPAWLYFPGMFCMILGNFTVFYLGVITLRLTGYTNLLIAILLSPIYWVMMSIAAVKAFIQLVLDPWLWEKTTHGLYQPRGSQVAGDSA